MNDIAQRQQILMSSGWPNSTRPASADGNETEIADAEFSGDGGADKDTVMNAPESIL